MKEPISVQCVGTDLLRKLQKAPTGSARCQASPVSAVHLYLANWHAELGARSSVSVLAVWVRITEPFVHFVPQ